MTWGEFKAEVERQGVKEDYELGYIDVSTDFAASTLNVEVFQGAFTISDK